ncbi:hypothetical protein HFN62_30745 [Rhizobium leguminosarum]|uniref:hypothetical protein n=1 Tax=Rhizobium leguminosarum TaxID=384 RepID=UPI001C988EDD|nr:hypothetical protein [Rhizobium leguminosarum]MBY5385339.1 hypothetical protein [Rhizobium leguminosarum]MBY5788096.1 hypothetical protein [Rhizobium leguminosarum]
MAEVLITETDTDHRYRITLTDKGFLLSCAQRGEIGLMMGPSEWLYKTRDAAEKGLAFVMLMNAWWSAMTHGYPAGDLPPRCEIAGNEHADAVARLNDQPLVGREVKELRENLNVAYVDQ